MARSTASVRQSTEIEFNQWLPFFEQFTRETRGAHARLEVLSGEVGDQVVTEDKPFDGVSADVKDKERTVWMAFGATPSDRLMHGIQNAAAVRFLASEGTSGPALEVEAGDGTINLLQLTPPGAFSLPPAASTDRRQ